MWFMLHRSLAVSEHFMSVNSITLAFLCLSKCCNLLRIRRQGLGNDSQVPTHPIQVLGPVQFAGSILFLILDIFKYKGWFRSKWNSALFPFPCSI